MKKFFELPVEESKIMNEKKTDSERTSEENPLISFENVSFAYDDKKVLKDLSFQICEGEKVAILGENGAGKLSWRNIGSSFVCCFKTVDIMLLISMRMWHWTL